MKTIAAALVAAAMTVASMQATADHHVAVCKQTAHGIIQVFIRHHTGQPMEGLQCTGLPQACDDIMAYVEYVKTTPQVPDAAYPGILEGLFNVVYLSCMAETEV